MPVQRSLSAALSRAAVPVLATLILAACDGGPSAVAPAREHASAGSTSGETGGGAGGGRSATRGDAPRDDPRKQPVPTYRGKPIWAANRRHTAQENAQFRFERDGADFGAKDVDDYIAKAHAFVATPPKGAETLNRRNGDTLIYDPKDNVFAVVTRDGAPRTMFKPRDGAAYWAQQKDREARRDKGGRDGEDRG
ncbi:hypothetical protein C5708_05420 [Caulobacter sp. CCUG 60055]|uniref:hypothetical protein n=1 Tax=Caulobacter sp. CCUG 60055 TaxID=2100090 RepID=UPI001FA75D1B|nr:hypothetical protein [Caulobacter sp. CCUG 60055]MCI3179689.1 hypothetical protein [Caulobacter sp. CCUG 60055]